MIQPLDSFRASTWGWLRATLAGWGTILIAVAGILLTATGEWQRWPLALTAFAFLALAWKAIENLAARYDICDDRLIVRRGLLVKSLDEVELYRVKDIRLDFSLINQLAGLGTITVTSSDETTRGKPLVMKLVERAADRRERLRSLVDAARQKRRVREVDMAQEDY
jgi:uncharacterized membrane protein YdbT with pleckstrin-like domain